MSTLAGTEMTWDPGRVVAIISVDKAGECEAEEEAHGKHSLERSRKMRTQASVHG